MHVDAIVSSPPYADAQGTPSLGSVNKDAWGKDGRNITTRRGLSAHYGHSAGQLGAMPPGSLEDVIVKMIVDAIVSSPPYAGAGEVLGTHNGIDFSKAKEGGKTCTPARLASGLGYGHSAGQLGSMKEGTAPVSTATTVAVDQWEKCYGESWKGLMGTPHAFSHPAKFSRALIRRIYEHLALPPGSVVLDPFGGVALGALDAMLSGLTWVGCELESRHHQVGGEGWSCPGSRHLPVHDKKAPCKEAVWPVCAACLAAWREGYRNDPHHAMGNLEAWRGRWPFGKAALVRGDSRRLRECVGGVLCDALVSSPPFVQTTGGKDSGIYGAAKGTNDYQTARKDGTSLGLGAHYMSGDQGETPGNLGSLPEGDHARAVDAVVSSPPYEGSLSVDAGGASKRAAPISLQMERLSAAGHDAKKWLGKARCPQLRNPCSYGQTDGNLGNTTGATFWESAAQIVAESFAILRPGGVAVFVCKRFVRDGAIVEFSQQWAALCQAVGFRLRCWHRAMLVEDMGEDPNLFGASRRKKKERASFFRRLAVKKGSPPIEWEDVICLTKD